MCKQTGQMKFQLKNECESWGPNQKNKKEKSEIEAEAYGWGCPLCKASRPPQYALLAGKGSSQSSWNEMSWGELSCDSKWMPSAKCSARCTDIGTRTRLQPDPPPPPITPFIFSAIRDPPPPSPLWTPLRVTGSAILLPTLRTSLCLLLHAWYSGFKAASRGVRAGVSRLIFAVFPSNSAIQWIDFPCTMGARSTREYICIQDI